MIFPTSLETDSANTEGVTKIRTTENTIKDLFIKLRNFYMKIRVSLCYLEDKQS